MVSVERLVEVGRRGAADRAVGNRASFASGEPAYMRRTIAAHGLAAAHPGTAQRRSSPGGNPSQQRTVDADKQLDK